MSEEIESAFINLASLFILIFFLVFSRCVSLLQTHFFMEQQSSAVLMKQPLQWLERKKVIRRGQHIDGFKASI